MFHLDLESIIWLILIVYSLIFLDILFRRPNEVPYGSTSSSSSSSAMAPKKQPRRLSSALVKSMTVKTCVGIYDDLKLWKPEYYKHAPSDGLELTVNYVDTIKSYSNINNNANLKDEDLNSNSPTSNSSLCHSKNCDNKSTTKIIVAIHGLPGHYTNFDKLIEFYRHQSNVRVIVPNLPDFSHTRKTRSFWHTTKEKVSFLKDFLAKLNISSIDCLVSHSFGVQTIAALWEEPGNICIKSIALISPQPLWDPAETEKMRRVFRFKSELWYNTLSFFRVHKYPFWPMRLANINEFLMCCSISVEDDTAVNMTRRLELLVKLDIPVVLLYGSLERLISKTAMKRMNQILTVPQDQVIMVDPDQTDSFQDLLRITKRHSSFIIEKGGHYCHCNYHHIANTIIDNLIKFSSNLETPSP